MAIVGTSLGLVSAVGLLFVSSELSDRQEVRFAAAQQEARLAAAQQEARLAAARQEAADARTLADNLQIRLQPRTVTLEQRAAFLAAVAAIPKGKLGVYSFMNADPGTVQYANQIREMVVAAGFDSGIMVGMSMGGSLPVGAAIAVHSEASQPPFAGPVQHAFKVAGIPLAGIVDLSLPVDEVRVIVGLKPEAK